MDVSLLAPYRASVGLQYTITYHPLCSYLGHVVARVPGVQLPVERQASLLTLLLLQLEDNRSLFLTQRLQLPGEVLWETEKNRTSPRCENYTSQHHLVYFSKNKISQQVIATIITNSSSEAAAGLSGLTQEAGHLLPRLGHVHLQDEVGVRGEAKQSALLSPELH